MQDEAPIVPPIGIQVGALIGTRTGPESGAEECDCPMPHLWRRRRVGSPATSSTAFRFLVIPLVALVIASCDIDPNAEIRKHHVLSRIGYGPDPWSLERIEELGVVDYIDEQLHPHQIPDEEFEARLEQFESLDMSYEELSDTYVHALSQGGTVGANLIPGRELAKAKFLRSVLSRRQLEAVLIDFWFNHLNIYGRGGTLDFDVVVYEREAIRPYVLGRFENMLIASARSAGMLQYLDNISNTVEDPPQYRYLGDGINENYARELLELHTVGVSAGYTQRDVIEVARVLTGWSLRYNDDSRLFVFRRSIHDDDPKSIMGELELPADGGVQEGYTLLRFLARHPSTARFICGKLARRFVSEMPSDGLVEHCAQVWVETRGDLREVMRSILLSNDFMLAPEKGFVRDKVKRPLVFVASLVRATRTDPGPCFDSDAVDLFLDRTGESLHQARPPTGYPEDSGSWISPGTLLARIDLVEWAIRGRVGFSFELGFDPPVEAGALVDRLIERFDMVEVSSETRSEAIRLADRLPHLHSDPEHRARQVAKFLLSAPEFMRH